MAGYSGVRHSGDQPEEVAFPRDESARRQYAEYHCAVEDDYYHGDQYGGETALVETASDEVSEVAECQSARADMDSGPCYQPDGRASERDDEQGSAEQHSASAQRDEDSENQQRPGVGKYVAESLMEEYVERYAPQSVNGPWDYAESSEVQVQRGIEYRHGPYRGDEQEQQDERWDGLRSLP